MECSFTHKYEKNSLDIRSQLEIQFLNDKKEKLKCIEECDSAYTVSVINRENFAELFRKIDRNAIFLGIKIGSIYVGYVAFYANDVINYSAYITLICVAKKFQRYHLGSMLMEECIRVSRKAGMKQIRLEVLKRDEHAIAFYKAFGFYIMEEDTLQSYYMCKLL